MFDLLPSLLDMVIQCYGDTSKGCIAILLATSGNLCKRRPLVVPS
ncbi:hypothetical protein CEXT_481101, partial [Caerostris extrusa]